MASVFKYGSYEHPENEVNMSRYEVTTMRSRRNNQMYKLYRLHLTGVIKATQDDTPSLKTRIEEIIEAYRDDLLSGDAIFTVDGVETPHHLKQSQSSSGIRVKYRSWPEGGAAEWANCRTFTIILESLQVEYPDAANNPQIVWLQDTITSVGNTASIWKYRPNQAGQQRRRIIYPHGTQKVIREGNAVGLQGYVSAFLGRGPLGLSHEHQEQRTRSFGSPVWQGSEYHNCPFKWRYVYESNQTSGDIWPNAI